MDGNLPGKEGSACHPLQALLARLGINHGHKEVVQLCVKLEENGTCYIVSQTNTHFSLTSQLDNINLLTRSRAVDGRRLPKCD